MAQLQHAAWLSLGNTRRGAPSATLYHMSEKPLIGLELGHVSIAEQVTTSNQPDPHFFWGGALGPTTPSDLMKSGKGQVLKGKAVCS